ncbi:MAG: hypothetical protein EOO12_10645 [Chitinophagaceae bacterium]|nr:MAG: hypothetical protein EOO12_10645 [Chitinophagaceae bacterium]
MGYQIEAFIGPQESLRQLPVLFPAARIVVLEQGLALCPLTDELFTAMNGAGDTHRIGPFVKFTKAVEAGLLRAAGEGAIGYIEAGYFGGSGGQQGVVWKDGRRGRIEGPGHSAINSVLWSLGTKSNPGSDPFESIGLDRHRATCDWAEEAESVDLREARGGQLPAVAPVSQKGASGFGARVGRLIRLLLRRKSD